MIFKKVQEVFPGGLEEEENELGIDNLLNMMKQEKGRDEAKKAKMRVYKSRILNEWRDNKPRRNFIKIEDKI